MDWIFIVVAFLSEIIGTVVGFGSSTIALPLSLFIFDFQTALVLVAFLHIFGSISRIGFFRQGLDKSLLLQFGVPSVALALVGASLVQSVPQDLLKMILGLFLIAYTFWSWSVKFTIRPSVITSAIGGGLSGFFAGLIGTGGALRGAFLTAFGLSKEKYIATAAAIALAVDMTRLPIYLKEGFLKPQFYWMIPILLVVALCGSFIGKEITNKIPQSVFRRIVLLAIFIIGVRLILN
jgi:uncharacterized membrane protein YfcA